MRFHRFAVLIAALSAPLHAAYDQHPRFDEFAAELASEYNIDADYARQWLAQTTRQESVLAAIQRPAERTMEWKDYRKIFLTEQRIRGGKQFLIDFKTELTEAEQQYGVDKEIIAAIIGVETFYGQRMGTHRVLDALATLAFDYPQRPLFWRELKALFALADKEQLDIATLRGSYAGAMGYGQFIPTSYLAYAVDGDGDGRRDLLTNPHDAIASVANYFKRHGWQTGKPVVQRVRVSGDAYQEVVNDRLRPKWTVAELIALGVTPTDANGDTNRPASLVRLQGDHGAEFWLAEQNFYVITRYNHSRLYAMAVYQLSEALR